MRCKVDAARRVRIPSELCRTLDIRPGDEMTVSLRGGRIEMKKVENRCLFCGSDTAKPCFAPSAMKSSNAVRKTNSVMGYASARRGRAGKARQPAAKARKARYGAARAHRKHTAPKTKTGKGRLLRKQTPFSLATNYPQWAEARNIVWRK